MKFGALLKKLGTPGTWREAIASLRAQHGRGTSRHLAQQLGVSQRTAQRWMKGTQEPAPARQEAVRKAADPAKVAAAKIRSARTLNVGNVKVRYGQRPEGIRKVGVLHVDRDPTLRAELDRAADAVERGDQAAADRAMSRAILGGYGAQSARDGRDVARSHLDIASYPDGVTFA